MGVFRMKVVALPGDQSEITYRKLKVIVPAFVGEFYRSEPTWTMLRRGGPMPQALAVYHAYQHVTRQRLGHSADVAFGDLPARQRSLCKRLVIEMIAGGLQSGLIRHRRPSQVQQDDPTPAKKTARSLVENRVIVDKTINGTYL